MTFEEYDNTAFTGSMKFEYKGNVYDIEAANFPERLICLDDGSGDGLWVRCENVNLVK